MGESEPQTLSELRELLLTLSEVVEAEIEGEEPTWIRIEVSEDESVEYVVACCCMLDWLTLRRRGPRVLIVESE